MWREIRNTVILVAGGVAVFALCIWLASKLKKNYIPKPPQEESPMTEALQSDETTGTTEDTATLEAELPGVEPAPEVSSAASPDHIVKAPEKEPPIESGNPERPFRNGFLKALTSAPYPYDGKFPDTGKDFYDYEDPKTKIKYHTNRYGDRFREKGHYDDGSVFFYKPKSFDPEKPFYYVVFFHGHNSRLETQIKEYNLTEQIDASGKNLILIAPQLAKDAIDSSPGKFFEQGAFSKFMLEAEQTLAGHINARDKTQLRESKIILAAFSGGYKSIAYILANGDEAPRIKGIVLLDAMYEDVEKFQKGISAVGGDIFMVSLYTAGSCEENNRKIMEYLKQNNLKYQTGVPKSIKDGEFYFIKTKAEHLKVPLDGPPREPLANLLKIADL